MVWTPANGDFELSKRAKETAKQATAQDRFPLSECYQAKFTTISTLKARQRIEKSLRDGVGKCSQEMDIALPGKHTRTLYDSLKRSEATILAQLRTGMACLNRYLHRIGSAESDQCACGQARETVKHFLFRCTRWDAQRAQMLEQKDMRRSNLSFYLGGKSPSDTDKWRPNMNAVRATIRFATITKRLNAEIETLTYN